jgi:hypothetical protein
MTFSMENEMTKRATPKFSVKERDNGQPWLVMEQSSGDHLVLFDKLVGFDLRHGTEMNEAQAIANFLNEKLLRVSET